MSLSVFSVPRWKQPENGVVLPSAVQHVPCTFQQQAATVGDIADAANFSVTMTKHHQGCCRNRGLETGYHAWFTRFGPAATRHRGCRGL
ncbi:hypothetical protein WA026_005608 [Henosepilachna vigintioctopunctata]|uniref:Uncharacterized protein n=1 Tax=Henosepilachna vigintioctopunctata TaxID=420089 RepID=A0AAW1U4H3_9CUCU